MDFLNYFYMGVKDWRFDCITSNLHEHKLVTSMKAHFTSKVAMFE